MKKKSYNVQADGEPISSIYFTSSPIVYNIRPYVKYT
jgi:hypothetical protein